MGLVDFLRKAKDFVANALGAAGHAIAGAVGGAAKAIGANPQALLPPGVSAAANVAKAASQVVSNPPPPLLPPSQLLQPNPQAGPPTVPYGPFAAPPQVQRDYGPSGYNTGKPGPLLDPGYTIGNVNGAPQSEPVPMPTVSPNIPDGFVEDDPTRQKMRYPGIPLLETRHTKNPPINFI